MAVFPFNLKCSAVIVMVTALMAAIVFALGHDIFYRSLDGRTVMNDQPLKFWISSLNVSDQQIYISLGTLFAFSVRSFVGISVSTAFDQLAWKSINGKTTQIGVIDDLLSALKNGFTFFNLQLWKRFPISMTLGIICWILPITSMISPATLSVHLSPANEHLLRRVPRIDFSSANFVNFLSFKLSNPTTGRTAWMTWYGSTAPETQRIVKSVAAQGKILPMEPPAVKSSWSMEFHGPTLVCDHVNNTVNDYFTQNVAQAMNNPIIYAEGGSLYHNYRYLSWTPDSDDLIGSTPFYQFQENGTRMWRLRSFQPGPGSVDSFNQTAIDLNPRNPLNEGSPLSVSVAIFPPVPGCNDSDGASKRQRSNLHQSEIIHCSLHNASYQASFNYINGDQRISVKDRKVLNGISYIEGISNADLDTGLSYSNVSFMYSPRLIESLSYQSIMEAFSEVLSGMITAAEFVAQDQKGDQTVTIRGLQLNTTVVSTKLMDTKEMKIL
ncbi:unnamed protein product [Penicillium olsonii]|uniref:Uncharacterized protein n=1 Tax=Penicillium olsonii TaxID=99116 RepID=A0A9W4ML14_PENOL|nr:unnamed protein product [Penicillium olsonii]CAG8034490.1 unnamed protein product [Penicillium olsonii]